MDRRQVEALEIARRTWRWAVPDDSDVEAAIRRIRPRLRRKRSRRFFRQALFSITLIGLMAGLAWADTRREPPPQINGEVTAHAQRMAWSGPAAAADEPEPRDSRTRTEASPMKAEPQAIPRGARVVATAAPSEPAMPASSWGTVHEALGSGDAQRAERALDALTKDQDAATRSKAHVGLAQLAVGQGDCERAVQIAAAVRDDATAPQVLRRRARAIIARCR